MSAIFFSFFKRSSKESEIKIDNFLFELHYKYSVGLIFLFFVITTTKIYFGTPIECSPNTNKDFINAYCLQSGLYTYHQTKRGKWNMKCSYVILFVTSLLLIYFKGNLEGLGNQPHDSIKTSHVIYQWIPYIFLIQSFVFYLPRFIWRRIIQKLIKDIISYVRKYTTK